MKTVNYSREKVKCLFEDGETIKLCSGLWNNPLTHNYEPRTIKQIDDFYNWASKVEVKLNDDPTDKAIYVHGYSLCDMF